MRMLGLLLLFFLLVLISILLVLTGGDPNTGFTVALKASILAREIDALARGTVLAALGEVAGAGGELGGDGGVGGDPVCEGVFAVLDDTVHTSSQYSGFGKAQDNGYTYALLASYPS